jgi:hypothetical protein
VSSPNNVYTLLFYLFPKILSRHSKRREKRQQKSESKSEIRIQAKEKASGKGNLYTTAKTP